MSEVIDSKVVELKFNNAEFEKNVKTSLTTIEKLKKSILDLIKNSARLQDTRSSKLYFYTVTLRKWKLKLRKLHL